MREGGSNVAILMTAFFGFFYPSTPKCAEGRIFQTSTKAKVVKAWNEDRVEMLPNKNYWLLANASIANSGVPINAMALAGGFKVLEVSPRDNYVAYRIQTNTEAVRIQPVLKFPEFITLIPFDNHDKIDQTAVDEYKRRNTLKWQTSGVSIDDPLTELIAVRIKFSLPISGFEIDSFCSALGVSECIRKSSANEVLGKIPAGKIFDLSEHEGVQSIALYIQGKELNSSSRKLTGVESIQAHLNWINFGCGVNRVETCWNENQEATGEGIWIGISEGGALSSDHPDFQESGKIRTPDLPPEYSSYLNWSSAAPGKGPGTHVSHVAGIAAGNGQSSQAYGGQSFQWRGVAPKAKIIPMAPSRLPIGDVNNYSITGEAIYSSGTGATDDAQARHASTAMEDGNVCVWAAGNNGVYNATENGSYSKAVGYYSMLNTPKNCIMVGNVDKNTGVKNENSSMGPTRDGRIGPDLMAPGGARSVQFAKPIFTLDQAEIVTSSGVKVVNGQALEWSFTSSEQGWSLASGNGALSVASGALRVVSSGGPIVLRVPLPSVKIEPGDKLGLRYKMEYSDMTGISEMEPVYLRVSGFDQTNKVVERNRQEFLSLEMDLSNRSECYLCVKGSTMKSMDISVGELESVVSVFPLGGYFQDDGTSMSAPHVAGVVALMLQAYDRNKRSYFTATGTDIHKSPIWNSTVKAILIHTATDMIEQTGSKHKKPNLDIVANTPGSGSLLPEKLTEVYGPGPDWATGYGLINAQSAVELTRSFDFIQRSIAGGETQEILINIPSGLSRFRVTLAWDDPGVKTPSAPNNQTLVQTSMLVNDIDLSLVSPAGVSNYPWVLDPTPFFPNSVSAEGADMNSNFTQEKILANSAKKLSSGDHRNNVEVVDIDNPAPGTWKIRIKGYRLLQGPQDYSVVAKGINSTDPTTAFVFRDPSGVIFSQTTAKLQTKGCGWGTASSPSISLKHTGVEKLSVSRAYGLSKSSSTVNSAWLGNEANLKGGMVIRDPSSKPVLHLSPSGILTVPATGACNPNL